MYGDLNGSFVPLLEGMKGIVLAAGGKADRGMLVVGGVGRSPLLAEGQMNMIRIKGDGLTPREKPRFLSVWKTAKNKKENAPC